MAKKMNWWRVRDQSLAVAVRNVGFDLAVFDEYTKGSQSELKKHSIAEALRLLEDAFFDATKKELKSITKGVYVICLSNPFAIQYGAGISEIIYIGQGNVLSRLKSHYERSLFDFMQSLSGTNFDFYISEPKQNKASDYYKHVEHLLLDEFSSRIGGGKREFPLLNKNAGSNKKYGTQLGWDLPLKRAGKKPQWVLERTKFWNFAPLD
ncbi:MAG: hypothetical protein ACFE0S_18075 [Rhodospirillales bacterium]